MSRREIQQIRVDRNTVHCGQNGVFIIVHEEVHDYNTPEGERVFKAKEVAIIAANIYKVSNDKDDIRIHYVHGDSTDYIDVIDNFNEVLDMIHQITHKPNTENNQTT